jgi:hypothetical protein
VPPAAAEWSATTRMIFGNPGSTGAATAVWLAVASCAPAFAQDSPPNPPEEKRSENEPPVSYGVEIELGSGYADRGLVISDRPVVQPVTWVSGSAAAFSVWSNITLAETTDGSRPQILAMELTRAHEWRHFTIEPAVRMFFYRDPLNIQSSRSLEGWLYLSYHAGPVRLFANQSVDVLAYRGAYSGETGIAFDRRVAQRVEVGGSVNTAWASSTFNEAWFGIDKSALNFTGVDGWLTVDVTPHLYIGPHFQFTNTVDRAVRAALAQPTFFLVALVTGVEF